MFGNLFRRREGGGRGDSSGDDASDLDNNAVAALHLLSTAIRQVHPDRFPIAEDAGIYLNQPRIVANAFLGRPEEERFFPIDYEALLLRLVNCSQGNILQEAMNLAGGDPTAYTLMRGIWHEFKLQLLKEPHDKRNLGQEVQAATRTLIGFLNSNATTTRQPNRGP